MKTYKLFLMLAAATLVSCSSEDSPMPGNGPDNGMTAIGFNTTTGNLSRADQNLEDVYKSFGVWAYKSTTDEGGMTAAGNTVMANYLVGYNGTYGTPTGQDLYGSDWYYENLGNDDTWFKTLTGVTASNVPNQFLKYWDYSTANTYFYAYAPYVNGAKTPTFNPGTRTMTFVDPIAMEVATTTAYSPLYASTCVAKASYNNYVALTFKRFNAQMKIAFYENIAGYHVEILEAYDAAAKYGANQDYGTVAWAASQTIAGTDVTYSKEDYLVSAIPSVVFGKYPAAPVLNYSGASEASAPICFAAARPAAPNADGYYFIGESAGEATYSPTIYNVLPTKAAFGGAYVKGYRFFVSYRLVSDDTGEVITVGNAPVYVAPDYCQWESNKVYTYIFCITKNTGGTTDDPEDPDPEDPDDPALKPIVFKGMIVSDYETGEIHDINVSSNSHNDAH